VTFEGYLGNHQALCIFAAAQAHEAACQAARKQSESAPNHYQNIAYRITDSKFKRTAFF